MRGRKKESQAETETDLSVRDSDTECTQQDESEVFQKRYQIDTDHKLGVYSF